MSDCNTTGMTQLLDNQLRDGSASVDLFSVRYVDLASHKFKASGENTLDEKFCDEINANWYWAVYYGISQNEFAQGPEISQMSKYLRPPTSWKSGTWAFPGAGYKYFAIPDGYDLPLTIKEKETGFGLAVAATDEGYLEGENEVFNYNSFIIANTFGITKSYKVYRSANYLNDDKNFFIT